MNNANVPGLPQTTGQGLLMWGSGLYRHSKPFLAYVPLDHVEEKSAWLYAVIDANGTLTQWSDKESDATALFDHACLGEFSVTWNRLQWPLWIDSRKIMGANEKEQVSQPALNH